MGWREHALVLFSTLAPIGPEVSKPMLRPSLSRAQTEIRSLVMDEFWWTQGPSSSGQFNTLSGTYWTMKNSDGLLLFWLKNCSSWSRLSPGRQRRQCTPEAKTRPGPWRSGQKCGNGGGGVSSNKRFQSEKWSCKRVLEGTINIFYCFHIMVLWGQCV